MTVRDSMLRDAFDYVLPDDREEMSKEEMAIHLTENIETLKDYLRERGHDVNKADGSPDDLLKSIYSDAGTTTLFDSDTVQAVESAFDHQT